MKILLVEDDTALNSSLKASLEGAGYVVTAFINGLEGERHIGINSIDYIGCSLEKVESKFVQLHVIEV